MTALSGVSRLLQTLCEGEEPSHALQALDLVGKRRIGVPRHVFYDLLRRCIFKKDLATGREVHRLIMKCGLKSDVFLGSHLIRMFGVCGNLLEANQVFSQLPNPSVFTWSAIISAHNILGEDQQAIALYHQIQQSSVTPDGHVFVAVLKACASPSFLKHGKLIHTHIIESNFAEDVFVGSALIDMYGRCGNIEASRNVFNILSKRDVVMWSAMIANYAEHGKAYEAFQLFWQMQQHGLQPNHVTFVSILKACCASGMPVLDQGKPLHAYIIENGFESDVLVGNYLINMYAKCGSLEDACRVFDKLPKQDAVTWNVVIAGYIQHGYGLKALGLFEQMLQEGMQPDQVTFISILKVCSSIASLDQGKWIHSQIIKSGCELDAHVASTLLDMYVNCGSLEHAHSVFDTVSKRDVVFWSAMITGYVQFGHSQEAIKLFQQMQEEGTEPDCVTFVSILKACSIIGALDQGKLVHAGVMDSGHDRDVFVGNTLIDMYCRCGSLEDAGTVLANLQSRDLVTWNAIIAGYAQQNNYTMALQYFHDMQREGVKPNDVTFVSLLSACSHTGLVSEGCQHFKCMREDQGIVPVLDHYNSMVDILGRAGYLNKAEDLLNSVPFQPNVVGWTCLLGHCRTHVDVDVGRRCFTRIMAADNRHAAGYMLMSKTFSHVGMQADANKIQELRNCANAYKKPGRAFIEVDNKVHFFTVQDQSHTEMDMIYEKLSRLNEQIKDHGYTPPLD